MSRAHLVLVVVSVFVVLGGGGPSRVAAQTAGFDTLSVEQVLERRSSRLDSLLLPESTEFDSTGTAALTDSLDRGGAAAVRTQRREMANRPLRPDLGLRPLAMTTHQRVDGFRLGSGIEPRLLRSLRLEAAAAYGFARKRWSGRASAELGHRRGPLMRVDWADRAETFGPNTPVHSHGFFALVAGQDRVDYLHRYGYQVGFWPWRSPKTRLGVRWFDRHEASLDAATDFHFFGGGVSMQDPNPAIDEGIARGIVLEGRLGHPLGRARVAGAVGFAGGVAGGDFQYVWQEGAIGLRQYVPYGLLDIEFEGAHVGGSPPVQAVAYLGGDGNLRGYDRLEFAGRERASARIEYACALDLLARTRVPIVERAHVQFIPFLDMGTTWGSVPVVAKTRGTLEGDARVSLGLGLQRTLWLPGLEVLRLDVAYRTRGGDAHWSFWLRAISLDEAFGGSED